MPKQIQFEGEVHEFPDDFTDADIAKALGQPRALPTDAAIQQNVESAPSQQSGTMENAVGNALTIGVGNLFGANKDIGRGAEDASARMVSNVAGAMGGPDPAPINAQLQPHNAGETLGQFIPSAAMALAGGPVGAGLGVAADTGSIKQGIAAGATAGLGQVAAALAKGANLTPAVKWAATQTLAKILTKGGLGALVGGYEGGTRGAVTGAAAQIVLQQLGINADKGAVSRINSAVKQGSETGLMRALWNVLPAAVAHGVNTSFDSTDRTLNANSTEALAQIAKKRRDAAQVLR